MGAGAARRAMGAGILIAGTAGLNLAVGAARAPSHNEATGPTRWARVLSAFEKVRPGDHPRGGSAADLALARGECEAFQIFAAPGAQKVDVAAEALNGPGI